MLASAPPGTDGPGRLARLERRWPAVVAGLVAVAAVIRLAVLTRQSVWLDEAFSTSMIGESWGGLLGRIRTIDVHPPLYYALLEGWTNLFGESPAGLRSLSLLVGLPVIPLVFGIGRRLFDDRTGLVAAGLVTVSSFHVWYSEEARMYTLAATLLAAAGWFLLGLLAQPSRRRWVGLVLATAAALYTNYGAVYFALAALALVPIEQRRGAKGARHVLTAMVAAGVVFLPWVPSFVRQAEDVASGFWIPFPTPSVVADSVASFLAFNIPALRVAVALVVVMAAALGPRLWHDARRSAASARPYIVLGVMALLPPATALLVSLYRHVYLTRNLVGVWIWLTVLVARGASLPARASRSLAAAALVLLVGANVYGNWRTAALDLKPDWNRAIAMLQREARTGDAIVFVATSERLPFRYHLRQAGSPTPLATLTTEVAASGLRRSDTVEGAAARRIWAVVARPGPRTAGAYRSVDLYSYAYLRVQLYTRADGSEGGSGRA